MRKEAPGARWRLERKRALCERRDITLNGLPARISRRYERFAYVEQIESGLGAEWSWEAAERIAQAGGDFRTMKR